MGLEVMQDWGRKTANEAAVELEARSGVVREVKNCTGLVRLVT